MEDTVLEKLSQYTSVIPCIVWHAGLLQISATVLLKHTYLSIQTVWPWQIVFFGVCVIDYSSPNSCVTCFAS